MAFTPEEIETKTFIVTLRGYDRSEVRAFVSALALDYRERGEHVPNALPWGDAATQHLASACQIVDGVADALEAAYELRDQSRRRACGPGEPDDSPEQAAAERDASPYINGVEVEILACQERLVSCQNALREVASMFADPRGGSTGDDLDRPGGLGPAVAAQGDASDSPPAGRNPQVAVQREEMSEGEAPEEPHIGGAQPVDVGVDGGQAEGEQVQGDDREHMGRDEGGRQLMGRDHDRAGDAQVEREQRTEMTRTSEALRRF